jgi:hypothetical protein
MKTNFRLILGILLLASVSFGCKKLLDVEFDADFKATLPVQVAPTLKSTNGVFDETVTIDPTTNSDYQKYADKIVNVELTGVTGTITSVNPTGVNLLYGTVEVSKAGFNTVSISTNQSIPIAVGTTVIYDGTWADFNAIFKDQNPITIRYFGETDQPSVEFTYELVFATKVTANPLN